MLKKTNHRLPNSVRPTKYQLTITPNLADFSFTGTETINIEISKPTRVLTLHSADLKIKSAHLKIGKDLHLVKKISFKKQSETVSFHFAKKLLGKVVLSLQFSGTINDQLRGFYRSRYTHQKKEKYLATTQFEATDARRAFPCFDEPSHKAVFYLSVVVPRNLKVISNTIETEVKAHQPGLKIINFAPTPKMSTYLLALIIGEFEHLTTKTKSGVQVRVHTTPGKKQQAKFALKTTKDALEFLEEYFGIPFPLPVLDMIAIPDFSSAAMENWGAVTFRETALLVDDIHTSFLAKQRVAEVIAHELVHQWFGNLVTMEWWTHLWLNESFATYMAYVTVDKLFPNWNYWTKFVLEEQSVALYADSLKSTQPIEVEVKHPDEINELFDPAIVYAKGASVLRMLSAYIGEDLFRAGLKLYLTKHSYKNTSSIHLWDAFEKVSKLPVKSFMKTWTTKKGYPVIKALQEDTKLVLAQQRFTTISNTDKTEWLIPIICDQITTTDVLNKKVARFSINRDLEFIKLNQDESSFFITNYHISLLAKLLPALAAKRLSPVDRLAIIRNSLLLAKSGQLPSDVFLEILQYAKHDDSYVVWAEIDACLEQLSRMVSGTNVEEKLNNFKAELFGQLITRKSLTFKAKKDEPESLSMLRGIALLESGLAGYKPSIKVAKQLFTQRLQGKTISADLRLGIYSINAKYGDKKTYEQLLKIYRASSHPQERQQILFALTKFKNKALQHTVMKFLFTSEVRGQDRPFVLSHALNNPDSKSSAWEEITSHWQQLFVEFSGSKLVGVILAGAKGFNTKVEAKMFDDFIKEKKIKGLKLTLAKVKEQMEINIAWQKRDLALIRRYLA